MMELCCTELRSTFQRVITSSPPGYGGCCATSASTDVRFMCQVVPRRDAAVHADDAVSQVIKAAFETSGTLMMTWQTRALTLSEKLRVYHEMKGGNLHLLHL